MTAAAALALAEKELQRQQFLLERKVGTDPRRRARDDRARARAGRAQRPATTGSRLQREGVRRWQTQQARGRRRAREERAAAVGDGRPRGRDARAGRRASCSTASSSRASSWRPASPDSRWPSPIASTCARSSPRRGSAGCSRGSAAEVGVDAFPGRTFQAHGHRDLARRRVHAEAGRDAERAREPRLRGEGRSRRRLERAARAGSAGRSRDSDPDAVAAERATRDHRHRADATLRQRPTRSRASTLEFEAARCSR